MYKIEIGAGFVVSALGGSGILQSLPASVALLGIGILLMSHGCYEIFFKPRMFLRKRLVKWLLNRNWKVRLEKHADFYFIIWAEDDSGREVMIGRTRNDKGILAFTALIHQDNKLLSPLDRLEANLRRQLIEDIKAFLAGKDMAYKGPFWPMNKLAVKHALPLDSQLTEHVIDLKAKEVVNAVIGVHSLIRKSIIPLTSDND